MTTDTIAFALELTVRLAAVGLVIGGMETIVDRDAYNRTGPFASSVFTILRGFTLPALVASSSAILVCAVLQAAAAAFLVIAGPFASLSPCMLVTSTITSTLIRWRRVLGGDGAEQLTAIILISTTLASLPGWSNASISIVVVFVTAQAILAYFTAGFAKLVSPIWRSGIAVPTIVNTSGHGLALATTMLDRFPSSGRWIGWSVIAFEIVFPAALLAPLPIAHSILAIGVVFHVGCAIVMGLNGFLWAFPATYPCVLASRVVLSELFVP